MFEPSLGSNAIGGMFQKEGTGKSKLGFFLRNREEAEMVGERE
jgi:hypothetical protein